MVALGSLVAIYVFENPVFPIKTKFAWVVEL